MNSRPMLLCALATLPWLLPVKSRACINDYVPNKKAIAASRSIADELTKVELVEPWATRRDRLRKEVAAGGDYTVRNDLANALMHTGDAKGAVQILEEIEKTNPGLYQTASNLGTAYELAGENAKALEWIKKGIERNPKSHDSSEWIHVKILESKIALEHGAELPGDGSVLGLEFDHLTRPMLPTILPSGNSGETLSLDQIEAGLKYQLRERLQFVKPPDLTVASLLFDLGNIIALKSGNLGPAQGVYELADKYVRSDDVKAGKELPLFAILIHSRLTNAGFSNLKRSFFATPEFAILLAISFLIAILILLKILKARRGRAAQLE